MATELPEPHFVDRDPAAIRAECVAMFEAATEKPLLPSQVERLLIDIIVYRETLIRIRIQEAAKQNLVRYASYPMIDLLGDIVGALRLEARAAQTIMGATLAAPEALPVVYDTGTRIRSADGKVTFRLTEPMTIAPGLTSGSAPASCTVAGPLGNGYVPGQVAELVDAQAVAATWSNLTETNAGAAAEDTPQLQARIPDVVAATSTAGPKRAYAAHARAAHPDILDVAVTNPAPGVVRLTVLTKTGPASPEVLGLVLDACNDEDVRPLCDTVQAQACTEVAYTITCGLWLQAGADATAVQIAATIAAAAYAANRRAGLGRTPVLSKVFKALEVGGVHEVVPMVMVGPVLTPDPVVVPDTSWANCTSIAITVLGFVEEEE